MTRDDPKAEFHGIQPGDDFAIVGGGSTRIRKVKTVHKMYWTDEHGQMWTYDGRKRPREKWPNGHAVRTTPELLARAKREQALERASPYVQVFAQNPLCADDITDEEADILLAAVATIQSTLKAARDRRTSTRAQATDTG